MRNTKCVSKRFSSNEWPAPGALRWCLKATGWMDRLTLPPHYWDSFCWMCLVFAWLSKYCSDEETEIAETDLLWRFPTNRCQRRARRAAPAFGLSAAKENHLQGHCCKWRGCCRLFHFMVSLLLNSHQRSNSKLRCCIRFKSAAFSVQ